MNYRKHYDLLILKYGTPKKLDDVFKERHHIVPKALGGTDLIDNLTYLTPREHFVAHWLLWKIHRCRSTALAFKRMCEAPKQSGRANSNSRVYGYARRALSESMTGKPRPDLLGTNNPMCRPEVARNISKQKIEYWKRTDRREYAARKSAGRYVVTYPDGQVVQVTNLKKFCIDNRINYSSLLYSAKTGGNPRRAKGFTCKEVTTPCEYF